MIPYIQIPSIKPLGLPIQPFGVLVGIGLVIGYMLGRRRARLMGLDPNVCADGMVWTVVSGFVIAHLVSVIFYFPEKIAKNPLVLLMFWAGLSSFGGFIGGALGAYWYFRRKQGVSLLQYADAIIFGLVPGWVFGRMGCTVVHDHPGKHTDFFFAVAYPGGARHDLGLYEMVYSVLLTGILYAVKNVRPFWGFHPALMLLLYAPVRFMFDFLRTADKHYFGFTPGQYFAVGMFALGIGLIINGLRLKKKGIAPRLKPPEVPKGSSAPATSGKGGAKRGKGKRKKS